LKLRDNYLFPTFALTLSVRP